MEIRILHRLEGAREARGLAVIIDVFRAFSTACYVMANGADRIVPVADIEDAYRLKRAHPEFVLMGERGGRIQPGFDFGNSPTHVERVRFDGKTVVHTTSAGTQGIASAADADEVITGSFVNAEAIVRYVRLRRPRIVSLVAMGWGGIRDADEDELCAQYLRDRLEGRPADFPEIVRFLREDSRTGRFLDLDDRASAPESDFDLCLALDRFSFVLRATPWEHGFMQLVKAGETAG